MGKQTLNGAQALGYCRIRKIRQNQTGTGTKLPIIGAAVVSLQRYLQLMDFRCPQRYTVNGLRDDYGRTWRQRTVINAVFEKVKSLPRTEWLGIANKLLDKSIVATIMVSVKPEAV